MSDRVLPAILLTIVFTVTAVGYLVFAMRRASTGVARVSDVLHVLMSVAMLSMPWSWGMKVAPPVLQIVVFSLATVFYLLLLAGGGRFDAGDHHGPGGAGIVMVAYHVVMMAAMVLMGVMMLPMAAETATTGTGGMSMGMSGAWVTVSWVLAVVFAATTVWMILRMMAASRSPRSRLAQADGALLLMSAGMALAFIPAS